MSGIHRAKEFIRSGSRVFMLGDGLYLKDFDYPDTSEALVPIFVGIANEDIGAGEEVEVPGPRLDTPLDKLSEEQKQILATITPRMAFAFYSGLLGGAGDIPLIHNSIMGFHVVSKEGAFPFTTIEAAVEHFMGLPAVAKKVGGEIKGIGDVCGVCGWNIPQTEILMKLDEDSEPRLQWLQVIFTCPHCDAEIVNPKETPVRMTEAS